MSDSQATPIDLWSWRTPKLVDLLLHRFPEPIAVPATSFLSVCHPLRPPKSEDIQFLIRAADATAQLLVHLIFAEYVRLRALRFDGGGSRAAPREPVNPRLESALRQVLGKGDPASTSQWFRWLDELPRELEGLVQALRDPTNPSDIELVCPKLPEIHEPALMKRLLAFSGVRNEEAHGTAFSDSSRDEDRQRFSEGASALASLWTKLEFFSDYRLVRVLSSQPPYWLFEERTGALRRWPRLTMKPLCESPWADVNGPLFLVRRRDGGGCDTLPLSPFLLSSDRLPLHVAGSAEDEEAPAELGTGMLQGAHPEKRKSLAYHWTFRMGRREVVPDDQLRTLREGQTCQDDALGTKLLRRGSEIVTVGSLVKRSHERTRAAIDDAKARRVYLPAAYVDRPSLKAHLDAWQASESTQTFIVSGMAGAGKTSLLCHVADTLLESGRASRDVVLLLPAAQLPARAADLEAEIARELRLEGTGDLRTALDGWKQIRWNASEHQPAAGPSQSDAITGQPTHRGRIWLLVDSLDRSQRPLALLEALVELLRSLSAVLEDFHTIKLMISSASAVFESREAADRQEELLADANVHRAADGPFGGNAVLLAPLDHAEVELAYERYRYDPALKPRDAEIPASLRSAFRNPLVMRLACQAFAGRDLPPTETDILIKYTRDSVFTDAHTVHFVRDLVRRLVTAEPPRRQIPKIELIDDPRQQAAVLGGPQSPYARLLENHFLTELDRAPTDPLAAPETVVEFTFDVALGYLMLALHDSTLRSGERPDHATPGGLALAFAKLAPRFPPAAFALDLALRALVLDEGARAAPTRGTDGASSSSCLLVRTICDVLEGEEKTAVPAVARFLEWYAGVESAATSFACTRQLIPDLVRAAQQSDEVSQEARERRIGRLVRLAKELHRRGALELAADVAEPVLLGEQQDPQLAPRSSSDATWVVVEALRANGSEAALKRAAKHLDWAAQVACATRRLHDATRFRALAAVVAMESRRFAEAEAHASAALETEGPQCDEGNKYARAVIEACLAYAQLLGIQPTDDAQAGARRQLKDAKASVASAGADTFLELQCRAVEFLITPLASVEAGRAVCRDLAGAGAFDWAARVAIACAERWEELVDARSARDLAVASRWRGLIFQARWLEIRALVRSSQFADARRELERLIELAEALGGLYERERLLRIASLIEDFSGHRPASASLARAHVAVLTSAAARGEWRYDAAAPGGRAAPGSPGARPPSSSEGAGAAVAPGPIDELEHPFWRAELMAAQSNHGEFLVSLGAYEASMEACRAAQRTSGDVLQGELHWALATLALAAGFAGDRTAVAEAGRGLRSFFEAEEKKRVKERDAIEKDSRTVQQEGGGCWDDTRVLLAAGCALGLLSEVEAPQDGQVDPPDEARRDGQIDPLEPIDSLVHTWPKQALSVLSEASLGGETVKSTALELACWRAYVGARWAAALAKGEQNAGDRPPAPEPRARVIALAERAIRDGQLVIRSCKKHEIVGPTLYRAHCAIVLACDVLIEAKAQGARGGQRRTALEAGLRAVAAMLREIDDLGDAHAGVRPEIARAARVPQDAPIVGWREFLEKEVAARALVRAVSGGVSDDEWAEYGFSPRGHAAR